MLSKIGIIVSMHKILIEKITILLVVLWLEKGVEIC